MSVVQFPPGGHGGGAAGGGDGENGENYENWMLGPASEILAGLPSDRDRALKILALASVLLKHFHGITGS